MIGIVSTLLERIGAVGNPYIFLATLSTVSFFGGCLFTNIIELPFVSGARNFGDRFLLKIPR